MDISKIRTCSYLLPDPGGGVVRELVGEIERLRKERDHHRTESIATQEMLSGQLGRIERLRNEVRFLKESKPTIVTSEYRIAPGGDGEYAATWKDKPHRLLYDLCDEIDELRATEAVKHRRILSHDETIQRIVKLNAGK